MSFFLTGVKMALRTRLSRWRSWLLLLLTPALLFQAKRLLPARETSAPVQVGVVLPREGGEEFWGRLEQRSGLVVTFLPAAEDEARRQVAAGRWDCALILPEDFRRRLERREVYELFTLVAGPGSTVYPVVRETVAACVLELIAPDVAEGYLLQSGILEPSQRDGVRSRLEEVLPDRERVLVSMETWDGEPLDPILLARRGGDTLLAGLLALALLVSALFLAVDLGRWLDTPFARRARPARGTLALLLPQLVGGMLPLACTGALALLALGEGGSWASLGAYLLFLTALVLVLSRYRPLWTALPVLTPFVPAAGVVLSPILLDLSPLLPALAPLMRVQPITLYLRARGGSQGDGWLLLLEAAILLSAAIFRWETGGTRKS